MLITQRISIRSTALVPSKNVIPKLLLIYSLRTIKRVSAFTLYIIYQCVKNQRTLTSHKWGHFQKGIWFHVHQWCKLCTKPWYCSLVKQDSVAATFTIYESCFFIWLYGKNDVKLTYINFSPQDITVDGIWKWFINGYFYFASWLTRHQNLIKTPSIWRINIHFLML